MSTIQVEKSCLNQLKEDEYEETFRSVNKPAIKEDGYVNDNYDVALDFIQNKWDEEKIERGEFSEENRRNGLASLALINKNFAATGLPTFYIFELPKAKKSIHKYICVILHTDGVFYYGEACKSKSEAKGAAALAMVKALELDTDLAKQVQKSMIMGTPLGKRTANEPMEVEPVAKKCSAPGAIFDPAEPLSSSTQYFLTLSNKNSVSLLNEILTSKKIKIPSYEISEAGNKEYLATVAGEGLPECSGIPQRSKQLAKQSAARVLINALVESGDIQTPQRVNLVHTDLASPSSFYEYIRHVCFEGLISAFRTEPMSQLVDTHLSGCVMIDGNTRTGNLVSLACGSYAGPLIYNNGFDVRDCDALVLCKRGVQHFLFQHIQQFYTQPSRSIFYLKDNQLTLRPNITFHFYMNYSPVADSSISNLPVTTKPTHGINKFAPRQFISHSMNTVDKVMKWNVTGIQGAVLSSFIGPIFVRSFTINFDANPQTVQKAFYGRCPELHDPISQPHIEITPSVEPYMLPVKPYSSGDRPGMIWTLATGTYELVSCTSGFNLNGNPLSISQNAFFEEACKVYQYTGKNIPAETYSKLKQHSAIYHNKSYMFKRALEFARLGTWCIKQQKA